MKVEVEDISKVEKRLNVELPSEMVDDEIEEQFQEFSNKATVPGFRPGKAPRKVLERRFSKYVHELVAEKLVKETIETALDRKGLKPVVEPVVDPGELAPGQPYKYSVHLEVKPEVELKEYTGLSVKHLPTKVTEEDVDKTVENMRENVAPIKEPAAPRPAKAGDQITARVTARHEGEPVEFGKDGEEQVIDLWRQSWIPDLAGKLAGHDVGDTVAFSAAIPDVEDAPAAYRGKALELSFELRAIKERVLPEINDVFAKEYTRFETLAELRDSMRKMLEDRAANMNLDQLQAAAAEALVAKNPVEVPPSLVKIEAAQMAREFLMRNFRRKPQDQEVEHFQEMFMADARRVFEVNYLLDAIAEKEGLEASEEDVEKLIEKEAPNSGLHPDKFKARLDEAGREALKRRAVFEKALDFLISHANIIEEKAEKGAE